MLDTPTKALKPKAAAEAHSERFRLFRQRLGRYWNVARWLAVDALWRYRLRVAILLALSGAALALQAGALGALLSYAKTLEKGGSIGALGIEFEARTTFWLLIGVLALSGSAFVAASFLRLYSERGFFEFGRQYALFCSSRLIALLSQALHGSGAEDFRISPVALKKLLGQVGPNLSRTAQRFAHLIPALAGFIVFTCFLIYLDPILTAAVAGVMLLSFVFFYRLSIRSASLMNEREALVRETSEGWRSVTHAASHSPTRIHEEHPFLHNIFHEGAIGRSLNAFLRVQAVTLESGYINSVTQALVIIVIGLIKGSEIFATASGFGELLIFLAAGRMAMSHFLQVTNALVMMNRFYPRVAEYYNLVKELEAASDPSDVIDGKTAQSGLYTILAEELSEEPASRQLTVEAGSKLALLAAAPFDRLALLSVLPALKLTLHGRSDKHRVPPCLCWIASAIPVRLGSLAASSGLPAELDGLELRRRLNALGISKEDTRTLPSDLSMPIGETKWEKISPVALAGAALLAAIESGRPIIFIHNKLLNAVGKDAAEKFCGSLSDRIVICTYEVKEIRDVGAWDESHALLFDSAEVYGYVTIEELRKNPDIAANLKSRSETMAEPDILDDEEL